MKFEDLFRGFSNAHGQYSLEGATVGKTGKTKGKPITLYRGATAEDYQRHLNGHEPGIGIVPLLADNESVYWGAIDIDDRDVDHTKVEQQCERFPVVITKSKSGGAHVWIFFNEPVPAQLVQAKLGELAALLGYGGCEIFPKQYTRANEQDVGNWINLPYFGDTRRGVLNGQEIKLERFLTLAASRVCTITDLLAMKVAPEGDFFTDGPPCLQHLHQTGFMEGTRNNGLFNVGAYLRLKHPDDWQKQLLEYNLHHMAEPLASLEVQGLADNLSKKDYQYSCKQPPIVSFCNKALCKTREFGVAGFEVALDLNLGGLTKYDTNPPMWILEVENKRLQIETDDMLYFQRFAKLCVERLNRFPTPVSPKAWTKTVQGLLSTVNVITVPADASADGLFFVLLQEFIQNRSTENRDELATGNVWVHEGFAHFKSLDFFNHLRRQGFTNFSQPKMYMLLREQRGAEKGEINIKGNVFNYWKIDAGSLQTEAFDKPDLRSSF